MVFAIADNVWTRMRGLARSDFSSVDGMLFLFPFRWRWGIWMRGMRCGVMIFWIDDGKVVGMERREAPTCRREERRVSRPPCRVSMVLELKLDRARDILKKLTSAYYVH